MGGTLAWYPELGWGTLDVKAGTEVYDKAYFERYLAMSKTPMSERLMQFRTSFVNRWATGYVLDYGAAAGAFVANRGGQTFGWDINPHACEHLSKMGKLASPGPCEAICLFDVLEHLRDPSRVLNFASKYVFVTVPIFFGPLHVLQSKHYRPTEHCWYFTAKGLVKFMELHGFSCVGKSDGETKLGREDIGTFAFRRMQ